MHIQGIKGRKKLFQVKASKNKYKCYLFTTRFVEAENFLCTICITKKNGCAARRNKIRRWFREALQEQYKVYEIRICMFLFVIPTIINYQNVRSETYKLFMELKSYREKILQTIV